MTLIKRNGIHSKGSQILLAVAVVLICFTAGVLSVLATRDQTANGPVPNAEEAGGSPRGSFDSPAEEDQVLVLILGTDRLSAQTPELSAIWYATYRPPGSDIFLYGLPLSWRSPDTPSQEIGERFTWSRLGGVPQAFLDALPLAPDAVLVMDAEAFASLIDFTGGINFDGSHLSGAEVNSLLERLGDQPDAQLKMQARVLRALAARSSDLGSTPDLTPLLAQIPEHAHTSLPAVTLISNLSPLLPLSEGDIHIQLLAQD